MQEQLSQKRCLPKTPGAQISVRESFAAPGAVRISYTWSAQC